MPNSFANIQENYTAKKVFYCQNKLKIWYLVILSMCVCQCGQECRSLNMSAVSDPLGVRVAYGFHTSDMGA